MKTEEQIKKAAKNRAYRELNKETLRLKRIIKEENEEVKLNIKNTNKDWYLRNKLYCREEIKEWMPFIREVVAFYSAKKKIIVLSGAAAHIVNFMRKNSAVIKHCEKWERSRNVKASI